MSAESETPLELHPAAARFIQEAGSVTQSLGIGRIVGQIYAFLFFSPSPRTLDDMRRALGISKGSASMSVRQLEQWDAVRRVWVRGDRKDYYEANDWLGRILKNAVIDTVGKRMTGADALFREAGAELDAAGEAEDAEFVRDRLAHLQRFYGRARKVWDSPLVKAFLQ